MFLDQFLRCAQLPLIQTIILRQPDLGLKPELRLAVRTIDVNVAARLLAREEVEPILTFAK